MRRVRCSATNAASRPTPSMKLELRKCWKRWPEHVEPGSRCDPTALADLAAVVEDRHVQPGVATAVSGGPDDGPDAAGPQVEAAWAGGWPQDRHGLGGEDLGAQSDGCRCGGRWRPAAGAAGGRRSPSWWPGRRRPRTSLAVDGDDSSGELDAGVLQSGEVEAAGGVLTDELEGGFVGARRRGRAGRRWCGRGCRGAAATSRCPCPGSAAAGGCAGRRPARRHGRRAAARRRAARRWPRRRRPARRRRAADSDGGSRGGRSGGCRTAGGRRIAGIAGRSHHPVATTTFVARHDPSHVVTWYVGAVERERLGRSWTPRRAREAA